MGVVYESLTTKEFEMGYDKMDKDLNLKGNKWLIELYEGRQRWVPTFVKDKEKHVDFDTMNVTIALWTKFPLELQFRSVYTNSMFHKVQVELRDMKYYDVMYLKRKGPDTIYKVLERVLMKDDATKSVEV
ncbi:unnamed protein product [Dovyalis caffra]|uniref:Protein FAR1-RELATED SEQUENCE n=1 Tax=Dovyalis caffra TaxID=77055 RepID=A0AAV1SLP8_9ROSI|nr:unnamed protein product [Dovyalis caffra]